MEKPPTFGQTKNTSTMKTIFLLLILSLSGLPLCMGQKMKKLETKEEVKPRTDRPIARDGDRRLRPGGARRDTTVSILPNGAIKVSYPDGSWVSQGDVMLRYNPATGDTMVFVFNQVQMAEAPQPLPQGAFSNDRERTWKTSLDKWLEWHGQNLMTQIEFLLGRNPQLIKQYKLAEDNKCDNLYERVDYRGAFIVKIQEYYDVVQKTPGK